jgi:hypothetical protein
MSPFVKNYAEKHVRYEPEKKWGVAIVLDRTLNIILAMSSATIDAVKNNDVLTEKTDARSCANRTISVGTSSERAP